MRLLRYVESSASGDASLPFFASPCLLGPEGVREILPLGPLSEFEAKGLAEMRDELAGSIAKGVDFAGKN